MSEPRLSPGVCASPGIRTTRAVTSDTWVVSGVSGCGKTTVGRLLGQRLGVPFADADDFHSEQARATMAAGHALTDADRAPWLERLAGWLGEHPDGAVLACSALRRRYRDVLRTAPQDVAFLQLEGPIEVAQQRVATRPDHFMPPSLVTSQYATLEPLGPDEPGLTCDFRQLPDVIVAEVLAAVRRSG